ncbi:MAG: hypothetical protein N3D78_03095 [Candidatus Aenigmarchaeota archaeon]|nr:hypothetical protein [Candidatus Aenigmarchaeota archaeon]
MIFTHVHPILIYITIVFSTLVFAFLVALKRKRRSTNLILLSSKVKENVIKTIDGIAKPFEIAGIDEVKALVNNYKKCIYIVDEKEDLKKQIEKLKGIMNNFEDFYILNLNTKKGSHLLNKKLRGKIYNVRKVEELREVIPSLLSK